VRAEVLQQFRLCVPVQRQQATTPCSVKLLLSPPGQRDPGAAVSHSRRREGLPAGRGTTLPGMHRFGRRPERPRMAAPGPARQWGPVGRVLSSAQATRFACEV